MAEHKPCPFCGSKDQQPRTVWKTYRFIACRNCKGAGPVAKDDEQAWELWDRRPSDER